MYCWQLLSISIAHMLDCEQPLNPNKISTLKGLALPSIHY
jgi:hypothetical protein